jgi:hypothetical protein
LDAIDARAIVGRRTSELCSELVMTSIVYVRAIRFEDGGVWNADISMVEKEIRQKLPILRDLGVINPPISEQKKP